MLFRYQREEPRPGRQLLLHCPYCCWWLLDSEEEWARLEYEGEWNQAPNNGKTGYWDEGPEGNWDKLLQDLWREMKHCAFCKAGTHTPHYKGKKATACSNRQAWGEDRGCWTSHWKEKLQVCSHQNGRKDFSSPPAVSSYLLITLAKSSTFLQMSGPQESIILMNISLRFALATIISASEDCKVDPQAPAVPAVCFGASVSECIEQCVSAVCF